MWKLLNLFLFCFITLAIVSAEDQNGCSIKLPDDIKGFAPVILTSAKGEDYKLFKPSGEVTNLKANTNLILACTGNKNVFRDTTFDTLQLKCSRGKFVDLNNNVQRLHGLVCKYIPSSSMMITTTKCSNGNGNIYESGFIIDARFYGPVFKICYNNITENTFYTYSILNGAAMKYSIPENTRRPFTADGMKFSTSRTNKYYTKQNQIERFQNYFGKDQIYVNEKKFLARGHLAADADFIFPYEQLSTYYYVNVAPEFQAVNAGNWGRVEQLARDVSVSYKDDIESYNGYMGTLALPNINGDLLEVYLDDTKLIEVPKYYFKVLLHRASDAAIVFLTVNNPYIENGPAEEICRNVCRKSGLLHPNFPNTTKGYTFCCELKEFKLLVDSLPENMQSRNLLKRHI